MGYQGADRAGQPSLHGYDACMVYWTKGALRRNCRQKHRETSFSPSVVFLFSQKSRERFWSSLLWHLWIGRTRHPVHPSQPRHVGVPTSILGFVYVFFVLEPYRSVCRR